MEIPPRQPVHTVYGGAHLFRADTAKKLGRLALATLEEHAKDAASFGAIFHLPDAMAEIVRARVVQKLSREPVEDLRVDFEDGYGTRRDEEEDSHAAEVGRELARGLEAGSLPPFVGVRVKSLGGETAARSLRTLERVLGSLLDASSGRLPSAFVVTLPKVEQEAEVARLAQALLAIEASRGLAPKRIRLEIMVETPRALVGPRGEFRLGELVQAGEGRCVAAHFGAYDYTASLEVAAVDQSLGHPACDLARQLMQLSLAGSGVMLSDGATNVLPVPVHKATGGASLTDAENAENHHAIANAWRMHASDVRRSLAQGFYQGWDLHPAQLVSRYAALHAFFRLGLPSATPRLRTFVDRAAQASLVGTTFDDAASGQGLLNFFLRGVSCGALDEAEVLAAGITLDELHGRSFAAIARARGA